MLEKIKELVAKNLNVDPSEITEQTRFVEDLHADSLDLVEIVMEFEEEFGVSIPEEDFPKLTSVGEVLKYVEAAR